MFLHCYVSPYTIVLHKIDMCSCKRQLENQQRHLEITTVVKVGAYIVPIGRKTTLYRLEGVEIAFFRNTYQDIHSNAFLYFADLPMSPSLYRLYSSRAGLHYSV